MNQLPLPFVAELDKQLAEERASKREDDHRRWAADLLENMVDRDPPAPEEWDIMLMGIRLDRLVSHLECEKCNLATQDHTANWLFPYWDSEYRQTLYAKVCLKDLARVTGQTPKSLDRQHR